MSSNNVETAPFPLKSIIKFSAQPHKTQNPREFQTAPDDQKPSDRSFNIRAFILENFPEIIQRAESRFKYVHRAVYRHNIIRGSVKGASVAQRCLCPGRVSLSFRRLIVLSQLKFQSDSTTVFYIMLYYSGFVFCASEHSL